MMYDLVMMIANVRWKMEDGIHSWVWVWVWVWQGKVVVKVPVPVPVMVH